MRIKGFKKYDLASNEDAPPTAKGSTLASRDVLDLAYAKAQRISNPDSRALRIGIIGSDYHARYLETGGTADIEKAVSMFEEAMRSLSDLHPLHKYLSHDFVVVLNSRFYQKEDPADNERAILLAQKIVVATRDTDPDKASFVTTLCVGLLSRYRRFGEVDDLNRIITLGLDFAQDKHSGKPVLLDKLRNALFARFERLRDFIPDKLAEKSLLLGVIGDAFRERFDRLGNIADLEQAISLTQIAANIIPNKHPDKLTRLNALGGVFNTRFNRLGNLADLEQAMCLKQNAVNLTPDDHPNKPHRLQSLGMAFYTRFNRLGNLADLEQAISLMQIAVNLTPDGHPGKPHRLSNLGASFKMRFGRLGNLADLEQAISLMQIAVNLTPDGHPNKPPRLQTLANAFKARFDRLGNLADLEQAISLVQIAVDLTPDGHPDKPPRLQSLGNAFSMRFDRLGNLVDLEQAMCLTQDAVNLTPDDDPGKPNRLQSLGNAFSMRFDRLGNLVDLEQAISLVQIAVDLTPDGHPDKPSHLQNLGVSFEMRFSCLGNLADLEQAISLKQNAVNLTPNEHPDKLPRLKNLGNTFETRFIHFGSLADLEQAISLMQNVVDLTPDDHPNKPGQINSLGGALQRRFHRLRNPADLEQAISLAQNAVDLTPSEHPDKPRHFSNLGASFKMRFNSLGNLADLEQAISLMQNAVNLTPTEHPDKPSRLYDLGNAFEGRFNRLGNLADLEQAISLAQNAVDLTPDEHPGKPTVLANLVLALMGRFFHFKNFVDLDRAVSAISAGANSPTGSPMDRFKCARGWAQISRGISRAFPSSRSPLSAFDCAIGLLPRIAWHGLAFTDQHAHLAKVGSFVREAVRAAIEMDEYQTAVEWAEQGRSIVWQNLLGLRSPLEELRKVRPELADRLKYISQVLEGSGSHTGSVNVMDAAPLEQVTRRASELAIEWDQLVEEVRKVPSFEDFLKAKSFEKLAPAADEGPVVILNVHKDRCDALVLVSDTCKHQKVSAINISLPTFSYKMAEELSQTLNTLLALSGRSREPRKSEREGYSAPEKNAKFEEILSTLWFHVAKPVIDGLGYQIQPENLRRIWWCATGPLAFLPIHAAGVYDATGVGKKLSDYVVSSYTPTLTAILDSSQSVASQDFQLLTVAQPSTPCASPLPGTTEEVRLVKSLSGSLSIESLTNDEATVERVLQGMERSTWIHLACHGKQDREESMKSGFLLHDGILELSELVKARLPKADFAFLSACQTATGDENVTEESVHLAAGMLFSGFRGVVATMWSIGDEDAPKVAADVYRKILENGKPDRRKAAYALHQAVQQLQKNGAGFLSWVPFIHIGR